MQTVEKFALEFLRSLDLWRKVRCLSALILFDVALWSWPVPTDWSSLDVSAWPAFGLLGWWFPGLAGASTRAGGRRCPLRAVKAWLEVGSRCIGLCRGNKKDGFWEVNMTLFDVKNLSSPHSGLQCNSNDSIEFWIGTLEVIVLSLLPLIVSFSPCLPSVRRSSLQGSVVSRCPNPSRQWLRHGLRWSVFF